MTHTTPLFYLQIRQDSKPVTTVPAILPWERPCILISKVCLNSAARPLLSEAVLNEFKKGGFQRIKYENRYCIQHSATHVI